MRTLPHIAIACGSVWAGSRLLRAAPRQTPLPSDVGSSSSGSMWNDDEQELGERLTAVDYRLVAFGSVLPDMVDRVQRAALRPSSLSRDQHLLGHTLAFNLPLLFAGVQLARSRGDWRLLALGAAAVTHLLADPVVRSPGTLLWPLLGLKFPEARGLGPRLTALTQIAAAAVVVATIIRLQRQGRLQQFLSSGRL